MISKFIKGKVYVFIDAANILYSQQSLGWRVDYNKLKKYFEKECNLGKLFFYTGKIGTDHKQNRFIQKMKKYGYIVKTKEVKFIKITLDTYEKKGDLDVDLAIDVFKHMNEFDTCILMSGDSDFAGLVDELKTRGKRVIVMSTKGHISRELIERAKYINLKKLKDQIIFDK